MCYSLVKIQTLGNRFTCTDVSSTEDLAKFKEWRKQHLCVSFELALQKYLLQVNSVDAAVTDKASDCDDVEKVLTLLMTAMTTVRPMSRCIPHKKPTA